MAPDPSGRRTQPTLVRIAVVILAAAVGALSGGVAIAANGPAPRFPFPPPPPTEEFVGMTPARVLDTRGFPDGPIGIPAAHKLGAGEAIDVDVVRGAGIPADATSVAVNITIDDDATLKSFLTVSPTGEGRPLVSANNAEPGLVASNSGIFKLGPDGKLSVYNQQGAVNVIMDVTGYFLPTPPSTTTTVAAAPPAISTDAAQYATGATVTFTGKGFVLGCTNIKVNVFGPGGSTVATIVRPAEDGSFSGTFSAPNSPGNDALIAEATPAAPGACSAFTTFDVVAP